jgi:hypothetical protein
LCTQLERDQRGVGLVQVERESLFVEIRIVRPATPVCRQPAGSRVQLFAREVMPAFWRSTRLIARKLDDYWQ